MGALLDRVGREGHRLPGSLPPLPRRAFDIREASSALHLVRSPRLGLPGCSIQYGMPPRRQRRRVLPAVSYHIRPNLHV